MKIQPITHIIAVITALTMGVLYTTSIKAETTNNTGSLIYNNRAFVQDIGYAPNPAPATKVQDAEIIYVNTAYGPAIYSYPSNANFHHTAFNVEYVDTAYGPAIYSYPRNNMKHHLKLADYVMKHIKSYIVPATWKMSRIPASSSESLH